MFDYDEPVCLNCGDTGIFEGEPCPYCEEVEDEGYDDSMDGDFDSAMESAGFGTDEDYDYGHYGNEDMFDE